tara:strand:- start:4002 stop:5507 length:1506 start_codon:yes stop_codon:yes gene_type:complete
MNEKNIKIVWRDPNRYLGLISHEFDPEFQISGKLFEHFPGRSIKEFLMGELFQDSSLEKSVEEEDKRVYFSEKSCLFGRFEVEGISKYIELAKNLDTVISYFARHRDSGDYVGPQPFFANVVYRPLDQYFEALDHLVEEISHRSLTIPGGDNLFVWRFKTILKKFETFMFLRPGHVKIFPLSKEELEEIKQNVYLVKYFIDENGTEKNIGKNNPKNVNELEALLRGENNFVLLLNEKAYVPGVLPSFLEQHMFKGVDGIKDDLMTFSEYVVDTDGKNKVGRTKTGLLNDISPLFLRLFYRLQQKYKEKEVIIGPMNMSASIYPGAINFVGESPSTSYKRDQLYFWYSYPHYAEKHPDAKIEATIRFGEPISLSEYRKDQIEGELTREIKKRIGLLETPYPAAMLFRAMGINREADYHALDEIIKPLIAHYQELGINVSKVTDSDGNPLSAEELAKEAARTLNCNPRRRFREILEPRALSVISNNLDLQKWYGNNLRHLDDL